MNSSALSPPGRSEHASPGLPEPKDARKRLAGLGGD